jgi:hypothetical protein
MATEPAPPFYTGGGPATGKTGDRIQNSEFRRQKTEDRRQKTEDIREDRIEKIEERYLFR